MMNTEIKAQWVDKLRNGGYAQGLGVLRSEDDKFCCLGVLCELAVEASAVVRNKLPVDHYSYGKAGMTGLLPVEVMQWSGLDYQSPWVEIHVDGSAENFSLYQLNDIEKYSFQQIADALEGDEQF
jgi:hypothetical protein